MMDISIWVMFTCIWLICISILFLQVKMWVHLKAVDKFIATVFCESLNVQLATQEALIIASMLQKK